MSYNKYCFGQFCSNNSKKVPDKYYFYVPSNQQSRNKWCIAVGRIADSLKPTTPAFCCSDHFDLEVDLDRAGSSSRRLKLLNGTTPSPFPKLEFILKRNADIMERFNVITASGLKPEKRYVREVVYIEENQNDSFLDEGNEFGDTLNDEPDTDNEGEQANSVELTQPDRSWSAPPSVIPTPVQNELVRYKHVKPTKHSPLQNELKKPLILRHIKQINSDDNRNTEKSSTSAAVQVQLKNQLPQAILRIDNPIILKPNDLTKVVNKSKYLNFNELKKLQNEKPTPILRTGNPIIRLNLNDLPNAVNKSKYLNFNELKKFQISQSLGRNKTNSNDDDDCILLKERNEMSLDKVIVNSAKTKSPTKILTSLPPSISIKYGNGANIVKYSNGGTFSLAEVSKPVPVKSSVGAPNPVFNLIKLMITENPMLLANTKGAGNCVMNARSMNEFRILDNVYYYRTNDDFENNYFYMNVTRSTRDKHKIIQRNYGIFWGNPRRSCVGIVETKGTLDDETKDFVFQQVKKSLFNEYGSQDQKLLRDEEFPKASKLMRIVREKSSKKQVQFRREHTQSPINNSTAVVFLDGENNRVIRSTGTETNLEVYNDPNIIGSKNLQSNLRITQPVRYARSVKSTPNSPSATQVAYSKELSDKIHPQTELIRLSNYLTHPIRWIINKLKYFELVGKIYTVNIAEDPISKDKPYNIVFTESQRRSSLKPVSKNLYVSRLVAYLFHVVYPFILDNETNEPVPIPPSDITLNISPKGMETLLINESRNKLLLGLNNTEFKHVCRICFTRFERKYQLKRHQFVDHNLEQISPPPTSVDSIAVALSKVPDTIRKAFMDIPLESGPSPLQSNVQIKREKVDETSDKSLLVPLEVTQKQDSTDADFSLAKVKQEPEEHFEELTEIPSLTDDVTPMKATPHARKRRVDNVKVAKRVKTEETDSASECDMTRTPRRNLGSVVTCKNNGESVQRLVHKRKGMGKPIGIGSRTIKRQKLIPLNRLELSKAKQLVKTWPSPTVDLVDIRKLRK